MTLVNRVSLFFQMALGLCLLGYSLATWSVVRHHLYAEFDGQLQHALNVLVAAIEVEDDEVKWQPWDHTITLGDDTAADEVRWVLVDEQRHLVDHSENMSPMVPADQELLRLAERMKKEHGEFHDVGRWRIATWHLSAPHPKPKSERSADEFAEISVLMARDSTALHRNLASLTVLVLSLLGTFWTLTGVLGRFYCRRALKPVQQMAERASTATGEGFAVRLPVSPARDELTDLATSFNGLLDRLQQSFQQQQRFTGDAAHQLRTPLTVLRGEIDLALRRPRPTEEYRQVLATLSEQTATLQEIVEVLLFLARTDGSAAPPEQTEVRLATWLPEFVQHWHTRSGGSAIRIEVQGTPVVTTSPPLLKQLLENLVSNAVKYSPPGSPVLVQAKTDGGQVAITVEDRGPGIAAEDQQAIFEPFFRSAAARRSGVVGTGLGLAIVARISSSLGGTVSVESVPGQGSRFTVMLPVST
ncbi:ATP-binding protein [Planctomicrobium piriforme]|uniref:histidine kinase n=1 Tax=Planctomicrobium piriforme TaxID=1576369 RepID=A0A1I3QTR6_9PLAN|nr:ATP-binding protein [Planctomicrobium piriforme]SFJ37130.1 heavy metal sensor kinase [Planctomicrobium piriforme]